MVKKVLGGDLRGLSNREKTMLIVALKIGIRHQRGWLGWISRGALTFTTALA